jgi:hypothetical protein
MDLDEMMEDLSIESDSRQSLLVKTAHLVVLH